MKPSSQKGVLNVVSLKSIHPQIRQLNFISRNNREYVDGFVGELPLEKRHLKHVFVDEPRETQGCEHARDAGVGTITHAGAGAETSKERIERNTLSWVGGARSQPMP